jgi:hypothetical protein
LRGSLTIVEARLRATSYKRFVRERMRADSTRSAVARAAHPALAHAHLARVSTPLAREFTVAAVALAGSWTHRFTLRALQFALRTVQFD